MMVNASQSLCLMKQTNSRLLASEVDEWASVLYQDAMHEADDAKDNQGKRLRTRLPPPSAKTPSLLERSEKLTLRSMREAKLWGSVGSKH